MHSQQTNDRKRTKLATRSHRYVGEHGRTSLDLQLGQGTRMAVG